MTLPGLRDQPGASGLAHSEHSSGTPRRFAICLLSVSGILDDPRIRRQGDAFYRAGWKVVAVGAAGGRSPPPPWLILTPQDSPAPAVATDGTEITGAVTNEGAAVAQPRGSLARAARWVRLRLEPYPRLLKLAKQVWHTALRAHMACSLLWLRWRPERGPAHYLAQSSLQRLLALARGVEADIYLANDWHTLPVVMELTREKGRLFAYDTHEYALEEYRYRLVWRLLMRPWVRSIESRGLARALVSSTVSSSIARDVAKEYGLQRPLVVIRNVPDRYQVGFRPCGESITVLFHGILVGDRGLEACVESVHLWRPEFRFAMRGPIQPTFRRKLDEIIARCGVADRVSFLPPVAMTDLVREANAFDIGIFAPPRSSKHNVYSLPNKFFEYIHAGLAVMISDMPDMAELVRQYDLGFIVADATPHQIATKVNELTRERIDQCKRNSLRAARDLNWDVEGRRLVDAYERALAEALGKAPTRRETAAE
jgi:glycosyltransferase involved in cell wall biosynthesis